MGGPCLPILISYCKDFKFWASHLEMPEKMVMNRNGGYLLASPLTFLGMLFTISLMSVLVVMALWDMTGTVSGWSIRCHLWITGQQRALGPRHTVTLSHRYQVTSVWDKNSDSSWVSPTYTGSHPFWYLIVVGSLWILMKVLHSLISKLVLVVGAA